MSVYEVFYAGGKKTNIAVDEYKPIKKGVTLDGHEVWHHVYIKRDGITHVSYDTVLYKGEHKYIWGSGHEKRGSTVIGRWEDGVLGMSQQKTWRDAVGHRTASVIRID